MIRWRRKNREAGSPTQTPPATCGVELPDENEARAALAQAKESRHRVEAMSDEVHHFLENMRAAREDNRFAEGIVEMIRDGR